MDYTNINIYYDGLDISNYNHFHPNILNGKLITLEREASLNLNLKIIVYEIISINTINTQ